MAQKITVEGRVVDKESSLPLPYVTVFVNNTAEGTVANENGLFELEMAPGHHELVLSLVGYENLIFSENFSGELPRFVFQMAQKPIDLNELQVDGERSSEWYENLRIFEYHFLGNSWYASSCNIINPEVLVIDFDQSVLKVHSTDFLIIENYQLGYRINYLLTSFELDTDKKRFHYLGYPRFTEMEGGKMKQRRWEKNRVSAYQGSWLHFKRSLRDGATNEAGFEVRKMKLVPNPNRPAERVILEAKQQLEITKDLAFSIFRDSLSSIAIKESLPKIIPKVDSVLLKEIDYSKVIDGEITLEFEDFLEVRYVKGKVSREFINSFVPGKAPKSPHPISIMSQTVPVLIYPTGLESNPLSLFLEGYWSWQKMGDALPIDYELPK
ncbi:carboxypeptidase-like regulatory domain-containing protein [Cyclobacterium jeungdonense]|uniref:Carboxypeptidase-like regulatory domain-containing protein n=2 Tax=Cyclobacterium jeungdonense TaxID=708087 RepID=A0ABT8C577_9BACT|nr:carboxypeptidase-like regulatory domain-containing protein [Cyclobacterium jeungdonense]MDN3686881.1 carboxypeptidase-like regulatory domain-containing protein [Cyclobacterium jeungdonense]